MIILDTNVISELMRPRPSPQVTAWLRDQRTDLIATTAITVAEIAAGLERLPAGRRRQDLQNSFDRIRSAGLVALVFDEQAAARYGAVAWARERAGLKRDMPDLMIAAIAINAAAVLATRNVKDFVESGVEIVNPFDPR